LKERVLDYNENTRYYTKFNGCHRCYNLDFCADIEICFKYLEGKLKERTINKNQNRIPLKFSKRTKLISWIQENRNLNKINKKLTWHDEINDSIFFDTSKLIGEILKITMKN
jgi:hypothetical protein